MTDGTDRCSRRALLVTLGTAGWTAGSPAAGAAGAEWPARILTPYDPGSLVDTTTRLLAEGLKAEWGPQVTVENRSGGNGLIAMNALLAAPADGHSLLTDTPASAINPALYKTRYDPKQDIAPIAQLLRLPFALVCSPSLGVSTVAELVALSRRTPGGLDLAVAGTSTGLVAELFALHHGIRFHRIPYKGAAPAMMAVLKEEAKVLFMDAGNVAQHVQAGRMTALLLTSEQRWPLLSEVPTAREVGMAGFEPTTWFGLFARGDVPQAVLERVNQAARRAMSTPKAQEFLRARGATHAQWSVGEFRQFFHREVDLWADVIRRADIKVD